MKANPPSDAFVVLCCGCGKTRDAAYNWVVLKPGGEREKNVTYSHAVCPECMQRLYGDQEWYEAYLNDVMGDGRGKNYLNAVENGKQVLREGGTKDQD